MRLRERIEHSAIALRWAVMAGVLIAAIGLAVLMPAGAAGDARYSTAKNYRFGVVLQNFTNPAIKSIGDAISNEAKKAKVKALVQDSNNLQEQITKAQAMISQKVDALALEPWQGGAIFGVLRQAKKANIPVFLVQDDAPGAVKQGLAVTYIAANETQGGALVGSALRAAVKNGDVAILEGAAGDSPAIARTKGFKSGLAGSDLNIVASSPADWARDKGLTVATDMLTANPDLKAIFAENDEMAFGALNAISAAGKKGDIYLAGYNGTCIGLQAALKGDFQLEGILFLDDVGRAFVRSALAHLAGKKVPGRDVSPFVALTTSQLQAVLKGKKLKGVPSDLRPRLQAASKGKC